MDKIPDKFYKYKQMPFWDENTLAKGFLEKHNTKAGVYARICILEWEIQYQTYKEDDEIDEIYILTPSLYGICPPQKFHSLKILWSVRFFVEFYKEKDKKSQELEKKLEEKYDSKTPHYEISQLISEGKIPAWSKVLDIGCGWGRNSFMLADNGCVVDALDRNQESLTQIQLQSQQCNWSITPREVDLENITLSWEYDFVFSTVVLQFLQKQNALWLIWQMQSVTKIWWYNLVIVPIDAPDYECPLRFPGLLESSELKELYQGWYIQEYHEMFWFFHRKDEHGNFYGCRFATIIAQKK